MVLADHLRLNPIPVVLAEFVRVMEPRAPLLVAFQSGEGQRVDRTSAYGHDLPLTYFRHRSEYMKGAAVRAGFKIYATVRRHPALPHETTTQAFVLA